MIGVCHVLPHGSSRDTYGKPDTGKKMKDFVKALLGGYSKKSYSQEGEDIILRKIFRAKRNGFYVDVGAHHPIRFSNTYFFFRQGWSGINIDAMPGSMRIFNMIRRRDINLELAISDKKEILTYYAFNDPALNGLVKDLSASRESSKYEIIFEKEIETCRLGEVLNEFMPGNRAIDFLSIDVEGFESNVLKSNNWEEYRPAVVLIEELNSDLLRLQKTETFRFLTALDYTCIAKTFSSVFFIDKKDA